VLQQPYDVEVGAGTLSPDTFFARAGPKPVNIAYAQLSRWTSGMARIRTGGSGIRFRGDRLSIATVL